MDKSTESSWDKWLLDVCCVEVNTRSTHRLNITYWIPHYYHCRFLTVTPVVLWLTAAPHVAIYSYTLQLTLYKWSITVNTFPLTSFTTPNCSHSTSSLQLSANWSHTPWEVGLWSSLDKFPCAVKTQQPP